MVRQCNTNVAAAMTPYRMCYLFGRVPRQDIASFEFSPDRRLRHLLHVLNSGIVGFWYTSHSIEITTRLYVIIIYDENCEGLMRVGDKIGTGQ